MATAEALDLMHHATVSDLGKFDADMVFGGWDVLEILEALNAATSCAFVGPHFTMRSPWVEMCVAFVNGRIYVSGPRRL